MGTAVATTPAKRGGKKSTTAIEPVRAEIPELSATLIPADVRASVDTLTREAAAIAAKEITSAGALETADALASRMKGLEAEIETTKGLIKPIEEAPRRRQPDRRGSRGDRCGRRKGHLQEVQVGHGGDPGPLGVRGCQVSSLRPVIKRGTGRVMLGQICLGRVWWTSSGAVLGSLGCSAVCCNPRLRVCAWQRAGASRAGGFAATQADAVRQLLRDVDLEALGFPADDVARLRGARLR